MPSVVIVGNSTINTNELCGKFINECDVVIRFNKYIVNEEYDKYIGSKTDFHVINRNEVNNNSLNNYCQSKIFTCASISQRKFYKEYTKKIKFKKSAYLCAEFYNDMIKDIKYTSSKKFSSGMLVLYYILNSINYKNYDIYLHNFTHSADHYLESTPNLKKYNTTHNWLYEKLYFNKQIENKYIHRVNTFLQTQEENELTQSKT